MLCESAVLNMPANVESTEVVTGLDKSVFIPIPKKGNAKECSNYCTIAVISHASKVMLKILQARFQQYINRELPTFKLDLEKAAEPEIKLPKSTGSLKKQESSRKTSISAYWLCQSLWLCGSQQTVENSSRDGNTRPPDLPPEISVCRSGSNVWKWTCSKRLIPNREWSMSRLYCDPAYLTYMQSTSCKILGWKKHKLESRLPGEISITSDMQMTPPLWQKVNKN